jgi:hypothetical protein
VTHREAMGRYVKEITAQYQGESGEPWDGRDQTVVFQMAVSFP